MKLPWAFGLSLVVFPLQGQAEESRVVSPALDQLFVDVSLYGIGDKVDVEQIFQKSGVTFYLQNGSSSQGAWKISDNRYCSQWPPNPSWACYDVMRDGDAVTFVSDGGTRFTMSLAKPAK